MDPADVKRLMDAWDCGVAAGVLYRARAILRTFMPHLADERFASLTVGERDCELLGVRRRLFGDRMQAIAPCAHCRQSLAIALEVSPIISGGRLSRPRQIVVNAPDDTTVVARLPNAGDLESAAIATSAAAAQAIILERCVESASRGGDDIRVRELSEAAVEELGARLEVADPGAHIELDASCPSCLASSRHSLNVVEFLWREIESEALRLLHDVHRLARGYGWHEPEILALSPVRRRAYLEMLA